jgi:predicted CoA-binding protein
VKEPNSFNSALTRQTVTTLTDRSHTVEVVDVYRRSSKAVAYADEYTEREDPRRSADDASVL